MISSPRPRTRQSADRRGHLTALALRKLDQANLRETLKSIKGLGFIQPMFGRGNLILDDEVGLAATRLLGLPSEGQYLKTLDLGSGLQMHTTGVHAIERDIRPI